MKKVTGSGQKVHSQKRGEKKNVTALERASWVLGIDIGKEKLSLLIFLFVPCYT